MEPLMIECRCCCKSLVFKPTDMVVTCPACTTVNTRPRAQGAALDFLRRATQQRSSCDFVNAERSYQHVLLDHPDEHEALWGLVLCRYGVEYVPDSHSGKHLPTVHFIRRRPMREDADFLHACALAPQEVKAQYEADAAYVDEVHSKAYSLSRTAQPWDIFLCYKATDPATGGDTPDLHRARELYYKLGQQGWRVFFAHDSLQSKAGASYEAPIFHALSTARVMLIVCSDSDWLKTSWVHSEWSRYLERMDAGENCHLVPLLYGMNPALLPTPFLYRHIEGLRMGELDAFDHLRTVLNTYVPLKKPEPQKPDSARELLSLQFALEDGSWERARTLSEAVLDRQPDNAMAHLYQLLAQLELHAPDELRLCHVDFQSMSAWKRACHFATESEGAMLEKLLNGAKEEQQKQENKQVLKVEPTSEQRLAQLNGCSIAAGYSHTVALKHDGTVVARGCKANGQCDVSDWRDIVAVAAASIHTVGLKRDGTIVAVGNKYEYGQLRVKGWNDWNDIVAISTGEYHTVGLKRDGTVVVAGDTFFQQRDVNNWHDIVATSVSTFHVMGLMRDGTVVTAGDNEDGQCNVGNWTDIVAIAAGPVHSVGLKRDGTVMAVGNNNDGQCNVSDWHDIVAIAAGRHHTVGLMRNGTVVATGDNDCSQCDVGSWNKIIAIAAGDCHTIGLTRNGTLVAAGTSNFNKCDVGTWRNIRHQLTLD
ncbi:MAG: TIR domain-containing protein [Aristaeellaceae bacterium]